MRQNPPPTINMCSLLNTASAHSRHNFISARPLSSSGSQKHCHYCGPEAMSNPMCRPGFHSAKRSQPSFQPYSLLGSCGAISHFTPFVHFSIAREEKLKEEEQTRARPMVAQPSMAYFDVEFCQNRKGKKSPLMQTCQYSAAVV